MIVKIHLAPEGKMVLAICDEGLLGKKFSEGRRQLDLTSSFYAGEPKNETEIKELIKRAHILNIVGEKSIEFALNEKVISKEHVIYIKNIPHAQALLS